MQPVLFLIIGGTCLILWIVFFLFYRKNRKFLDEMWAVDTYSSKDLKRMVSGGFDATVEVKGTVSCEKPVISFAAKMPCCYFHTTVARQERRTRVVTSGSGNRRRTRIQTTYVWVEEMDSEVSTLFKVEDSTGYTFVDPKKAL